MAVGDRRVGPTYDTLSVVVQPWPDRTTYRIIRMHYDGRVRTDTKIASGSFPLTPAELDVITPLGLLERVAGLLRPPAQRPAPPLGDMGEQLTLDLAFSP